jgi:hypothetical protein
MTDEGQAVGDAAEDLWVEISVLGSGPIKSRQHLLNHVSMLFGDPIDEVTSSRCALIRTCDGVHPWRCIWRFDDRDRLDRAAAHVARHSFTATRWEQVAVRWRLGGGELCEGGRAVPQELAWDILTTALELWAEMEDISLEEFMDESSVVAFLVDWPLATVDRLTVERFFDAETEGIPASINTRDAARSHYDDSPAWRAFSAGVCSDRGMREHLARVQDGLCARCGEPLGERPVAIHHVDYDHECELVAGGASGTLCAYCLAKRSEWFEGCSSRLRLLHASCNRGL